MDDDSVADAADLPRLILDLLVNVLPEGLEAREGDEGDDADQYDVFYEVGPARVRDESLRW
mgnify:CR=1